MEKTLLNIVSELTNLKSKDEILNSYVIHMNKLFGENEFIFLSEKENSDDIKISYNNTNYGYISVSDKKHLTPKNKSEINESIKLLAFIIHSKNIKSNSDNSFDFSQNLINTIPDPVFYKDADGKYLGCNKAFEEFVGLTSEEIVGKTVFETSKPEDAKIYYQKDKELYDKGGQQSYEWNVIDKKGRSKNVKFEKATFYNEDGELGGIIGIVTDITDAKINEAKLKYRLAMESILSNISARFFEESESNIDSSIEYALRTLGEFAGVDRSYVFLFDAENKTMSNSHEWHSKNVSSIKNKFQNKPFSVFPWGIKKVYNQETLIIDDVEKLLADIKPSKINLVDLNLKSIIIVPIIHNKKTIGFLGFNAETGKKNWDYGDSHVLKVVSGFINVALDKHRYISNLKEAEHKFRAVVEQSLTGIYIIRENRFIYVNPKFSEIFGYEAGEIIENCVVSDLVYEEDRQTVRENLSKRLTGDLDAVHYSFRGRRKEGSIINVDVHGRRSFINGEPVVVGVLLDITERVMIENSLRKLSKAVEQSSASVLVTDVNGTIEYVNPSFVKNTGYERTDVIDRNPRILKSHLTPKEVYDDLWSTIKSGNNWRGEILNKKKSGELYWEFNSISPIKNEKGIITHFVAVKEDVSEQKKMIEELKRAKETAEKANQLKSEFLAQISHEIRTPINILLSFSGLIWDDVKNSVTKELRDNYDLIRRAGNRIIRTIDLILNLSQIQVGSYDLAPKKINVCKHFADNIIPEYEYKSNNKGLNFNFDCGELNLLVESDEYMFDQIFTNLIDNAIKYTDKGGIKIVIDGNEHQGVYVDVIDTGIGISKEYLPNLFDVFSQEEQGYTRRFEGTGLGLSLVKNYCELNNAEVSVESEKGKGSKFRVTFFKTHPNK